MSKKSTISNASLPQKPSLPSSLSNSFMSHNQFIDSLTSHISLYHAHSTSSSSASKPNHNPRSAILKWFSSLTAHQRQAHLTTVDSNFTRIIIQMLGKVRARGHGCFIILPDLPSTESPNLPSLCYKKSPGLLARVADSNESQRLIVDSTRLFGSREGEKPDNCSCSIDCLDSLMVIEEFVENVDRFVETMDQVSNGEFLRGEEDELSADWVELGWLKAKGYYSMAAFIANRLELNLRLAWLNCSNGKKKGVKLKERLNVVAMAANSYWRKKGCVDWWANLDSTARNKVWVTALGKAAKPMTYEILKEASRTSDKEKWPFGVGVTELYQRTASLPLGNVEALLGATPGSGFRKPSSLANVQDTLCVLQNITTLILSYQHYERHIRDIFFSSLTSLSTIADCILRKLRGFLMVLSIECTKLELLEEVNCRPPPLNSKEKLSSASSRKKKKSRSAKRPTIVPKSDLNGHLLEKTIKDYSSTLDGSSKTDLMESSISPEKDICNKALSTGEMEHTQALLVGNVKTAGRKSRKKKNRKNQSVNTPTEKISERAVRETSLSDVNFKDEAGNYDGISKNSIEKIVSYNNLSCDHIIAENSSAEIIQTDDLGVSGEGLRCICQASNWSSGSMTTQNIPSTGEETSNCMVQCDVISHTSRMVLPDDPLNSQYPNFENSLGKTVSVENQVLPNAAASPFKERDSASDQEFREGELSHAASSSSSEHISCERPTVSPLYYSPINSHIPTATDRLHLDVGHNLHKYARQPFISTVHQARNSPIENGCTKVLTRPMPMSLDWPPMVRSACGLAASMNCNYDSGFISKRQSAFWQNFATQNAQFSGKTEIEERKYAGNFADFLEPTNPQELGDDCDSNWISEEEIEMLAVSGIDYNDYFGGGVMYWNPSDHIGTGFSRPPSLSSDDSSWAWHEADMSRAIDDMVAFSSSYSTNGLTSPTAASFCSPFDPLGPGHQPLSYVVPGNEVSGKVLHSASTPAEALGDKDASGSLTSLPGDVEGSTGDSFSYPILRPIIIPSITRERSRSEFKRGYDLKSPCVPLTRREQPRVKRPPSPVVLCAPRAPRPPPPSSVSDSRKHRGFSTVRSGSSSPRHWGMRGWYNDGTNSEEECLRAEGAEVVWPWRNKNLSTRARIQPLPGGLLQDHLIAISQLARDQDHPDVALPLQPVALLSCPTRMASLPLMQNFLHDDIEYFCKQVAAENMTRKPYINWAVKRVTRSLQVLWPRSRTNIFGSNATGLSLPSSDVDLVVCLPPVRNLEPIKEAGILEGRNGIKETCLQHASRYLANQEWVKNDSLKTVENTAIPLIMLVVEIPCDLVSSAASNMQSPKEGPICTVVDRGDIIGLEESASPKSSKQNYVNVTDVKSVRLDISFKTPSHTGFQTTELVKQLTDQFPAATPLALVLKQFLADRNLDQSYSGGLSSYCLVLLITRFLQHEHHLGRPINQNFGGLLMDFLYFYGNVFDPRQMRISVQGTGVYMNRERGYSIDPIHIDDPLFPTNNVGRNCFRIHQCIKAFSEAYSLLENELASFSSTGDQSSIPPYRLLQKIIPSINMS